MAADIEKALVPPIVTTIEKVGPLLGRAMEKAYQRVGVHLHEAVDGIAKTDAERVERGVPLADPKHPHMTPGGAGASDSAAVGDALAGMQQDPKKAARWAQYLARKQAEGKPAWTPERWSKAYETNKGQVARGAAWRDQYLKEIGLDGEEGWRTEVRQTLRGGEERRIDYGNETEREGFEFKSGSTPTKEAMDQLAKDDELLQRGWTLTWVLKKPLSKQVMEELRRMAAENPNFAYHVREGS